MENTERKRRKKQPRGNTYLFTVFLSYLILLIGRLIFADLIGENGMAYYAAVYEWVLFAVLIIGSFLPQAEARAVRSRMAKGQIKNAGRVLKAALLFGVIAGAVCAGLQLVLSELIAEKLLLEPLAVFALWVIAPVLLLSVLISAYRGYFEGIGTAIPTNISRIMEQIFSLVFGLIFGRIFYDYGEKTGKLVQNADYASAYAVVGIAIGMVAAQLLVLLFLVFINGTYSSSFKRQMSKDNSKIPESYTDILRSILITGCPYMLTSLFIQGSVFADMVFYKHYIHDNTVQNYTIHYGSFYGKYAILIGLLVCAVGLLAAKPLAAVTHFHKREEYRAVKEHFAGGLHTFALYGIPAAVLLAVLARPVTDLFFGTANGTVFLLQVSSSLVLLIPCALFFVLVLQSVGKQMLALRNCAAAFAAQTLAVLLFLNVLHLGIASVAYGYMVLFGVMAVLNGMSLFRYLKYSPEYIRIFVMPFVSSAVCGVLVMLLEKALFEKAGGAVTSIVCLLLGFLGYFVLLFALHGISERELNKIAGGRLLLKLGEMLRLV